MNNECVVPSCSTEGCVASAPVCNIMTDVCGGCDNSGQCSQFTDAPVCETASGSCVQCVGGGDCLASSPICEANACRGCKLDSECESGACGDDGACISESAIVYLEPGGTNTGTCSSSAPCRNIAYAITQTSAARNHIVLALGAYTEYARVTPADTSAAQIYIHGGGATISPSNSENSALYLSLSSTIRDLDLNGGLSAPTLTTYEAQHVLERVRVKGTGSGLNLGGATTLRDVRVEAAHNDFYYGVAIVSGANVIMERVTIFGGGDGIRSEYSTSTLDLTNVVIWGSTALAIDAPDTRGTIRFSTIGPSGTDAGTGPRAVKCGAGMTVRSSIVWAPGQNSRVPIEGCNLVSTIAGPTVTPGAMNTDPRFVNASSGDFHLGPNSPARDAVDGGPATDFEGDLRPQGARFDIGADEARQ